MDCLYRNLKRRIHKKSPFVPRGFLLQLEPLIAGKAKEKEYERKTTFQKSEKSNLPEINTVKEIAGLAGVSHDTTARVKVIEQKADEGGGDS